MQGRQRFYNDCTSISNDTMKKKIVVNNNAKIEGIISEGSFPLT